MEQEGQLDYSMVSFADANCCLKNTCIYLLIICTIYRARYQEELDPIKLATTMWSDSVSWGKEWMCWSLDFSGEMGDWPSDWASSLSLLLGSFNFKLEHFGKQTIKEVHRIDEYFEGLDKYFVSLCPYNSVLPHLMSIGLRTVSLVTISILFLWLFSPCLNTSKRRRQAELNINPSEEQEFAEISSALRRNLQEIMKQRVDEVRGRIGARRKEFHEAVKKLKADRQTELKEVRARQKSEHEEVKGRCRNGVEALEQEYRESTEEAVRQLRASLSSSLEELGVVEQSRSKLTVQRRSPPV